MSPLPFARVALLVALVSILMGTRVLAQAPVRDAGRSGSVGTATLSGTIVSDEQEPRPLRRVRVGITTSDRQTGRTVVTDDAGRFAFAALPAGRYMLTASKQGYVTTSYGARRPNRPGTTLVLADGQRLVDIALRMPRGAVVSGVIVDQNGEPYSGASVSVMRHAFVGSGQRTLLPASSAQTDDRGQFRVWGLAAGDYVVSANPGFISPTQNVEIARLTDADIKRALADAGAASPGASGSPDRGGPQPRTVGYATVFYPGTAVASQATPIKLGPAEERTGIDFALSLVATAKVEGTVAVPDGINAPTVLVQMVSSNPQGLMLESFRRATPAADGQFSFAGVSPGAYTVMARAIPPPAPGGRAAAGPAPGPLQATPTHFAMADVTINGQDIAGLSLTLQTGLTVSGRVLFEGTTSMPDVARMRINLTPVQAAGEVSLGQGAVQPDAQGAFSIPGVVPGRYRLTASIPGLRPDAPGWQIKSATIGGRDALDLPVDLREGADATVTFTDRVSELSGIVSDGAGQPAPEYTIVTFPRDKSYWTPTSRRIRSARPAADGKYSMPVLPPGDYLLTAVTDLEPGEQYDPAFLDVLAKAAVPITLGEGEKKTQDLRLGVQGR